MVHARVSSSHGPKRQLAAKMGKLRFPRIRCDNWIRRLEKSFSQNLSRQRGFQGMAVSMLAGMAVGTLVGIRVGMELGELVGALVGGLVGLVVIATITS
jgi:predicted lipid-binding transport protein (Tim44 family)